MRALWILALIALIGGILHFRGESGVAELHPDDPRNSTGGDRIVMLAADWCGYCRKQQAEFSRANVRYRILDVDTEEGDRAMRAVGARAVPVTIIGQDVVRGYNVAILDEKLTPLGYRVY
ncbi:glutaredoxin family protein [Luteimonas sp. A277]